jgi:hypothetical protein
MKYFLAFFSLIIFVSACSKNDKLMQLSGEVKGLKKGTLLLQKIEDTVLISVDSVAILGDSRFEFSEEIDSVQMYYLYVRLKDGTLRDDRIQFFAEPGKIHIKTNLKNFQVDAKITGSRNQDALYEYEKLAQRYTSKNLDLIEDNFKAARAGNDSLAFEIEKKQNSLIGSRYFMTVNFALNHTDYELAPYLILSEAYNSKIKYLDTVYNSLTPKIKDSKYGIALESFIENRKKAEN